MLLLIQQYRRGIMHSSNVLMELDCTRQPQAATHAATKMGMMLASNVWLQSNSSLKTSQAGATLLFVDFMTNLD